MSASAPLPHNSLLRARRVLELCVCPPPTVLIVYDVIVLALIQIRTNCWYLKVLFEIWTP